MILQVRVKPQAKVSEISQSADGTWIARLKAAPVDGKANAELIDLVAEKFRCRKTAISIKAGASGRMKLVKVST